MTAETTTINSFINSTKLRDFDKHDTAISLLKFNTVVIVLN
jgi:hypothetical protein